jgi:hypothetical protein
MRVEDGCFRAFSPGRPATTRVLEPSIIAAIELRSNMPSSALICLWGNVRYAARPGVGDAGRIAI